MLLMKWQFQNQLSSDDELQTSYYFRTGSYWNNQWNSTLFKYMIPFQKHPHADAQVSILQHFDTLVQRI